MAFRLSVEGPVSVTAPAELAGGSVVKQQSPEGLRALRYRRWDRIEKLTRDHSGIVSVGNHVISSLSVHPNSQTSTLKKVTES